MVSGNSPVSPEAQVLLYALEKLRTREGLTLQRLVDNREGYANPLLELAAVRRYADVHGVDPPQAALGLVQDCVRTALEGTTQIVADAVLALGALDEIRQSGALPTDVAALLRSDSLGRRRRALLAHWERLHQAHDHTSVTPPSDRVLRRSLERTVLAELAYQLIRRELYSVGVSGVRPVLGESGLADAGARGKVVVVGGAVMDVTFRTRSLPQLDTSSEASDFDLSPGGKALTQAVAVAKLGLDVAIVAAVADDRFGAEILDYLRSEGVDTRLVKVVDDARTPFTGVIELELGDSVAVNWRNDRQVRLDVRDVDRLAEAIAGCDALLLTFEVPRETAQRVLKLAQAEGEERRPIVIVTPGQPYPDTALSSQALAHIDYLVAHPWELGQYAVSGALDVDAAARRLLAFGVDTLCVPIGGGCAVYSEDLGTFTVPTFPSPYKESSVARDAFCAALAQRLIEQKGDFSEEVALWATAAMAASTADHPVANSIPDRRRIQQLLGRSRFRVQAREPQLLEIGPDLTPEDADRDADG